MSAHPARLPGTPHAAHERLLALLDEIARRAPRPDAARRVHVSTPHARSVYLSYVRLAGARDDVLDYAATMLEADAHRPERGEGLSLELIAVEAETDEELTLLFSRPLYDGE